MGYQFRPLDHTKEYAGKYCFVVDTTTSMVGITSSAYRGNRGINFAYVVAEYVEDGEVIATSLENTRREGQALISPYWMAQCRYSKSRINKILVAAGLNEVDNIGGLTSALNEDDYKWSDPSYNKDKYFFY